MAVLSRILIVDDDPDIRKVLSLLLKDSYFVAEAADGAEAVSYLRANPDTDLVVLDVMMPGMDGLETCEKLREFSNAPVLFLTAKSAERDRVAAYQSGGDDFLSKPFSQAELNIQGLDLDLDGRSVTSNGRTMTLTDTEYAILEHLLKNRGSVVTAAELYEAVWGEKFLSGSGNTVMVHVLNVRRKIEENPSKPRILRTVWGRGYQID